MLKLRGAGFNPRGPSGPLAALSLLSAVALLAGFLTGARQAPSPARGAPVAMAPGGVGLQITLGLSDTEPSDWSGQLRVSSGKLLHLSARSAPDATITGTSWTVRSRFQGQGDNRQLVPAVLYAAVEAPASASVEVQTPRGSFSFALSQLPSAGPSPFLNGAAAVARAPLAQQITRDATEDDFPACAASGANVWCAYVAYQNGSPILAEDVNMGKFDSLVTKGHGDQVRLVKFDGKEWSAPINITEAGLDVWRPTVAVDGQGTVWVAWSQNTAGEWDLHARSYDPKSARWAPPHRLTTNPGADFNVVAATAHSGRVWLAWQCWQKTDFGICAQPFGGRPPLRVRNLPGSNEWHPAIAADSEGKVYIAFDTYSAGNYDVHLWTLDDKSGARSGPGETTPIAASARFEARPSIAVDSYGRVWIAFEDSEPNWAKDFGSRWEGPSGVPFYMNRNILVRSLAGVKLLQTQGEVSSELITTMYTPGEAQRQRARMRQRVDRAGQVSLQRMSYPRLAADHGGRIWLLYRRHPLATGAGERWLSFATYYDGAAWTEPVALPFSENLLDNRPAALPAPAGGLLAVYSSDGRTAGTNTADENNLYVAVLAGGSAAEPVLAPATAAGETADPVHPAETEDVRRIRAYRATAAGKTYQLLRGEFHRHTEISAHRDQDGPLEEVWRYGLDAARMDWIGSGDHDWGVGREYTWWITQKQNDIYHHPPVFLPMHTYERSVVYPSGHRNVMFARRGIRALPRLATPDQPALLFGTPEGGSPDVKNLYAYLKFFNAIASSHTSATSMGTDWRDNDPAVEPVVEIYQGHRQNYEEPNAPKTARDAADSIGGYQPAGYVWNAFAKGYRLGFQVSSDHVSTHISYAIVYAERPTREAVVDAFRKRHSYGAHDNIILDVRSGDQMMGDEFTVKQNPRLDITVVGTAPVARVDIVRQIDRATPAYVYAAEPKQASVKLAWTDSAAQPGAVNMYYVRVMQQDGKMAWASPMWISYQP